MRLKDLILWEIKFQARYGFYLLYGFLTILYIVLLFSLPQSWRVNALAVLVFSDPAAMGLFFMGAIILLEKSQRLPSAFAVSPMRAVEYVAAKVTSLSLLGVLVAAVLSVVVHAGNCLHLLLGTLLSSVLFTLAGIIIGTKTTSLNQFILATVPVEIIAFVPAILNLAGIFPSIMKIYPASVCMDLISGRMCSGMGFIVTLVLIVLLSVAACRCVQNTWRSEGGVKL